MTVSNAIIFVGNTGVGKSYICSRLFSICGSSTRFKSSAGNLSETTKLQHSSVQSGTINQSSKSFTIVDSPGFFDTSKMADGQGTQNKDGKNVCTLVKALETYKHIYSIVCICLHGSLLHSAHSVVRTNSSSCPTRKSTQHFSGSQQAECNELRRAGRDEGRDQPHDLKVPEMAYQDTVEGEEYEEVVAQVTKDEGRTAVNTKDTSHYESTWERDRDLAGFLFGSKHEVKTWVPSTATQEVWAKMEVTRRWHGSQSSKTFTRSDLMAQRTWSKSDN